MAIGGVAKHIVVVNGDKRESISKDIKADESSDGVELPCLVGKGMRQRKVRPTDSDGVFNAEVGLKKSDFSWVSLM